MKFPRTPLALALALCSALTLTACGGGASSGTTTPTTTTSAFIAAAPAWEKAVVFLPNSKTQTDMAAIGSLKASPVAVVLHGCSGMGALPAWGPHLSALGYLVIMPDSLARSDRAGRFTCSGTSVGTGNLDIYDKRIEEAEYAIEQVRKQTWYDGRHFVLAGLSEGGFTVARRAYSGISAAVVSGYWCTGNGALSVATVAPTLTVNYTNDPFYFGQPGFTAPGCAAATSVSGSQHLVLPGAFHSALDSTEGLNALLDFARVQVAR